MRETPPVPSGPQEKPIGEMTVEELVERIKVIDKEIEKIIWKRGKEKDRFRLNALDLQFADKINEKAGYEMQRQQLLLGGQKES